MESPYAPMHRLWIPPHMTDIICKEPQIPFAGLPEQAHGRVEDLEKRA